MITNDTGGRWCSLCVDWTDHHTDRHHLFVVERKPRGSEDMDLWTRQIEVRWDKQERRWVILTIMTNGEQGPRYGGFLTKKSAVYFARGVATVLGARAKANGKPLELILTRKRSGAYQDSASYGTDSPRSKG